ncbi:hypothetical protein BgiBS90_030074 [Biomphalaria glabrata]|nr:hypothetical protein BgiBS90_030074 [Biomphalaria glabrata]
MMARLDRLSACLKCLEPGMYEIVKEPCTKTRDTKIMCEDGFYRHHVPGRPCNSSCVRCDTCGVKRNMFRLYEARECGGYHNTVCCHHDHMVVKEGKCHHKPTTTTTSARTTQSTELNTFVFNSLEEQEIDLGMSSSIQDIPSTSLTINKFIEFHFVISSLFVNMFLLNL